MGRNVYDDECPAFEVIDRTHGHGFTIGTHVVGAIDAPCPRDLICSGGEQKNAWVAPDCEWWLTRKELRPLTPAAVAMLALVKGK